MIRTIADASVTLFVWYVMLKQLWKVVATEWARYKRKRPPPVWDSTNAEPRMVQAYAAYLDNPYDPRVELKPVLSSDVYVAKCPHCNIAWPVRSKDDPTFLNHPKAIDPYHTVECEGSGTPYEGKLWNNNEYPYRQAIAEFKRAGAAVVCGPLEGVPKVLAPPSNAPSCLVEAFWSGCKSDYLDPSESHRHWKSACEFFLIESERRSRTKVTSCPKCGKEGESNREDTELVCPHCAHVWTNDPLPTYNHTRGDSPLTPCPLCERHPMHRPGSP